MSRSMQAVRVLRVAGDTDPGLQREVNEDRFHVDAARGLFMVIDGVGGQAAGGKAADTAVSMLRARLERETGPVITRLREAITVANNEIHRLASLRPEWNGMACVLTAVVLRDARAIVGHVGDTRLYRLHRGRIEKVTRDHSPVGEREDAGELSELDAMHHPRRNEVYRDVGSEPHEPADPDFIDVQEVPFEEDAALLLCSDGLTDLVDSSAINEIVSRWAGHPQQVVRTLIDAANAAGGKDNVTVVFVEGDRFAVTWAEHASSSAEITRRLNNLAPDARTTPDTEEPAVHSQKRGRRREGAVRMSSIALIAVVIVLTLARSDSGVLPIAAPEAPAVIADAGTTVVGQNESIARALMAARAGTTIVVEPGEYRETLQLKSHVRLMSRVPRGAVLRLPGAASEAAAAIVARGVQDAAVEGFRIVGDAATPLGTGILASESELSISQVEISGAAKAAIDVDKGSRVRAVANEIHDNPGAALAIRAGATATITHNRFARNATAGRAQKALIVDANATVQFVSNVFAVSAPGALGWPGASHPAFIRDNFFDSRPQTPARPPSSGR